MNTFPYLWSLQGKELLFYFEINVSQKLPAIRAELQRGKHYLVGYEMGEPQAMALVEKQMRALQVYK